MNQIIASGSAFQLTNMITAMYGSPITPKWSIFPPISGGSSGPDVHINIDATYQEANRLEGVADEVRDLVSQLDGKLEELQSIWMGDSARRMEQVMLDRADLMGKLADNIELIALGLRGTAQTYQLATMASGGK